MSWVEWASLGVVIVLAVAWSLSYSASRLDRLHARVEGTLAALDAQLVRRAEATLELANSGTLDAATALMLAGAASESLEAAALERVRAASQRVQLARRFHNDAVTAVRRVRRLYLVTLFRLAGHAPMPKTVEFADELPGGLR